MRAMKMFAVGTALVLAGGLGLVACVDGPMPPGEVTELGGLKIDESRIRSTVDGDRVDVQLVLERTREARFAGRLKVALVDLEGQIADRRSLGFELDGAEQTFDLSLHRLPATETTEQLARHLLRYRVEWDGKALFGNRSLYATVKRFEAQVLAPDRLHAGESTTLRVLARDPGSGEAAADVQVDATLAMGEEQIQLGQGLTDARGTAEVFIRAPADMLGSGELTVRMQAPDGGEESVTGSVDVMREEKVLVTTDKPLYQPGQLIHMRVLALRRPALHPVAGEDYLFEVRDGKGNKVFKHTGATDDFGIGAADFQLAGEVNAGDYEILARVGSTESIKTVEVKRYALPKFGVDFRPDRGYYLPGERVTGQVEARYFFGKPVHGQVRVKVFTFDVGLVEIGEVVGELNADGRWGFHYDLPTAFAGIDLLQGDAYLQFDVEVTDLAEHSETASAVSVVAAAPLKVALVPESGELVPGVANVLHVVSADPTGGPVAAEVELTPAGQPPIAVTTDARGLGRASLVPSGDSLTLDIAARDAQGNQMNRQAVLPVGQSGGAVLLRVAERLYQVGDTIHLEVLAHDAQDRIYLDAIKGNQTLLTDAIDLVDGRASYELELTPDMEGNVQFDAYYLTRTSQIVRDTQLVLVQGARQLDVQVSLDQDEYRPADTATVDFQVTDPQGNGVAAAIGLAVVDEAVFALSDMRPGLAETFFEIEQDIMQARYQIIRSSTLDDYLDDDLDEQQREAAAAVTFAAAQGFAGYGIERNTYVDAAGRVAAVLRQRIDEDAQGIMDALRSKGEQGLITPENLGAWLERHRDWTDPFGQPYRFEVRGSNQWDQSLIVHSAGPDELAGSPDDVASSAYRTYELFYGQGGRDWEFGGEDGMDPGTGGPVEDGECQGGDCGVPSDEGGDDSGGQAPRVRTWFPETLFVDPAVITDGSGRATVEIPLADSITTWRMSSLASSDRGRIGSRADGIRVFQDFFIDVDFPATLTRGDQVSLPVAVYNYLEQPQTVQLQIQQEDWFTLQDAAVKHASMEAGEVDVVYFTVTVDAVGWHGLTVHGSGSQAADAVRRTVEVVPDGKEFRASRSDRLGDPVTRTVAIPEEAIDGASRIFVKIYPGLMSQAVEGLDALLRIPNGCFEQTTTTAWPNIMVLNYLQHSGQLTPAIELKARDYVNQSYQRIVTFECPSGGFNWWVGDDPGNAILTAMALMMFADASRAVDIDQDLVRRSEQDLIADQQADGCWSGESHLHAGNEVYGESGLRASAFCTWGLAMSSYDGPAVDQGVACLKSGLPGSDDVYTKALVACALAWADPNDPALMGLLDELEALKVNGDEGIVHWQLGSATASGARGNNGDIETTALVAQAMMRAGAYPDVINGAITWLIQQKDAFGTWNTTQATVQSLRAMTMAMGFAASQDVNGTARVGINGAPAVCTFDITPDNADVTRICELDNYTVEGDNAVSLELDGEGTFLYQVVGVHYLPWELVSDSPDGPLSIAVEYDRTNLGVDDTVAVQVSASYNVPGERASMIMLDLGIPPGFEVLREDLSALVADEPRITRFEFRGRQLSVYVDELAHGAPLAFSYRMKALFPIRGQTPESSVWAYYNPEMRSVVEPVELVVAP